MKLLSRILSPPGARWDLFALHQEGVRGELRAVAHDDAVVDPSTDPQGAAVAEPDAVGLEANLLLGVWLDDASLIERAIISDCDHGSLEDRAAVIKQATANADAK